MEQDNIAEHSGFRHTGIGHFWRRERERGHFEKSDCEESGSSRLGSVRNLGIPDLGDVMEIVRNIILSNLRVLHLNE